MAVGIIAEYNPFHNGHLYHLNKIKEMYPDEEIILVMSGNFTQRGEVSIIDKWKKTEIALKAGIDLVIELPYSYTVESADYFSYGAVTILEKLNVEKFVFGSETNDIKIFEEIVDTELNNEEFDPLTKMYMKLGENYPTALSKSLLDLTGKSLSMPNDLLGISYVKIVKQNNYRIKPICIKRNNDYNSDEIKNGISSGKSIRKALQENINIDNEIPNFVKPYLNELHFTEDYFKFLKYKIITEDDLSIYQTVDEGIDFKIKKNIINSTSFDELINSVKSKRYTYSKISRMLNHILCGYTKEKAKACQNITYIRVLGFNDKGRNYLNKIKKEIDIPIISNYSKMKNETMELELTVSSCFAAIMDEEEKRDFIQKEYIYHPYYKEEDYEKN